MAAAPPASTNMNFNDPFFHPHESPASILTPIIFSSENYHEWSRAMLQALCSKNNVSFVDGSLKRPAEIDTKFLA